MDLPVVIEEMKDVPFREITRLDCEDELLKFSAPVLGKGATAIIPLSSEATLISLSGTPEQSYRLGYSQYYEGKVLINLMIEGRVTHILNKSVTATVQGGSSFIYAVGGERSYMELPVSHRFEVVSLVLSQSAFESALDRFFADQGPAVRQQCISAMFTKDRPGSVFQFSGELRLVVRQILRCRLRGNFRRVFLDCKFFELLSYYFASITEIDQKAVRFSARDVATLQEVRRALATGDLASISIQELCRQFGINRFKLTMGFHSVFNTSVARFYRQQVLARAYQSLADGLYNVSQASAEFGYATPAAFSRAFYKEFGIRPSEVTRQVRAS